MLIKQANHEDNSRFYNYEKHKHLFEAGKKGEKDAAYHINFTLGESQNWAVIHGLRLEYQGKTAQIDHLIINRFLEFYVLETKHSTAPWLINEMGEFFRCDRELKPIQAMASPIEQNRKHIAILDKMIHSLDMPKRLGIVLKPTYHSFILVSSCEIIQRPKSFDTSNVVKTDAFVTAMLEKCNASGFLQDAIALSKVISSKTLQSVAEQIVAMGNRQVIY